jgi:hypothetical protein
LECKIPSPDGSGNPFYAELDSVFYNSDRIAVEMLKRVQHKKIAANSGNQLLKILINTIRLS